MQSDRYLVADTRGSSLDKSDLKYNTFTPVDSLVFICICIYYFIGIKFSFFKFWQYEV
jgi:hypothetical protein